MKQENSMPNPIRSQCSLSGHSGGSILLNIIIMIVIFASIISAVVYMSSSSMRQAVSSNQSANAWNLAEAGYRFLSTNYLNTTDVNGNLIANPDDEDKAAFLRNVNGRTYVIPNNGSFTLSVRPYWFYNAGARTTKQDISVRLPGTTPANFIMPANGRVKLGDTPNVIVRTYDRGNFDSGTGIFTCRLSNNTTLNQGDSVYLVLRPNGNQALTQAADHNTLTLDLDDFSATAFPAKDGLIEIGSETRLYRYSNATQSGSNLILTNLRHSDNSTFSTPVTTSTNVTFKKCITAQSRGQVGPEQRILSFNQGIFDTTAGTPPVVIKLDTEAQLLANFSRSSSITSYTVDTLTTSGGGRAAFSIINSLATTGSGASAYKCGAFWYNKTTTINDQWSSSNNLLSYDIQVKPATGKYLTAGTLGLAMRVKNIGTASETYLGLTFMKYDLANLYFTAGSAAINPGDTLTVFNSNNYTTGVQQAIGVVQGTPEITSGSWAAGNAKGKIRFASFTVTGTVSNNYYIRVNGVNVAQIPASGTNYFPAATTDYIPGAIKPKPSDFSPARYNIGPLLLVLWERKSDGTFRWLAYKDISYDDYAKGLQDWNEPEGSCTGTCPENDGQIINDNASIYIRIQERRVVLGSGAAVKLNDINLFNGDASTRYITPARPGNDIPYDIKELRSLYAVSTNFANVIWVPQYISQWEQAVDYFSHIESGTPIGSQPQFQWDAINPNVTGISVLKICDDSTVNCTSAPDGTLRLTELVTPDADAGTYQQPEFGLLACGNIHISPDYASAGFAEFAVQISAVGGGTAGGFIGGSLSW